MFNIQQDLEEVEELLTDYALIVTGKTLGSLRVKELIEKPVEKYILETLSIYMKVIKKLGLLIVMIYTIDEIKTAIGTGM